jgi:hypothetical protein
MCADTRLRTVGPDGRVNRESGPGFKEYGSALEGDSVEDEAFAVHFFHSRMAIGLRRGAVWLVDYK